MDQRSKLLRRLIIQGLEGGGRGHIGSSLSLVEILRVLYDSILAYRPHEPSWPGRDRLILSKGHGCLALYAILADRGFFSGQELQTFCKPESRLGGHPERNKAPGVEASTGALGHGLPMGVGMVIVDYNKLQSYGLSSEVLNLEPLPEKWHSFGFDVHAVDGHDISALESLFKRVPLNHDKPTAIICHTVKGMGLPFAEGQAEWHHKSGLKPAEIAEMYACLD